jgi:pimeloyl-ACP methyl ester carboxylesterase
LLFRHSDQHLSRIYGLAAQHGWRHNQRASRAVAAGPGSGPTPLTWGCALRSSIILTGIAAALVLLAGGGQAAAQDDAKGDWLATLTVAPTAVLHLAFHLKAADGGFTGTMDSLDQGVNDLPLAHVDVSSGHLAFDVPQIGGRYSGAWTPAADGYVGDWSQAGKSWPLNLVHGKVMATPSLAQGLDGAWDGAIDVGPTGKLRLIFTLSTTTGGTAGNLQSIDQGPGMIALSAIRRDGQKVKFEIKSIAALFDGDLATDGKTLSGQWTQGGRSLPLSLTLRPPSAGPPLACKRPQQPMPPYPYRSVEVGYDNPAGHNHLAGTLTVPQGPGPFPVALLITGSGLQDRDETLLGHKPFLVLADYLTRRGIAVLRVDDRTIGGSTGDVAHATSADFATDVEAGVAYLKTRPEIDHRKIGLIGHSEGGMIAPMVAVIDPAVSWIVLMAGPGIPGDELLTEQGRLIRVAMGMTPAAVAKTGELNAKVFAAVKASSNATEAHDKAKAILTTAGMTDAAAEAAVGPVSSDWFRFFFSYDPAPTLARVRVPILAINGSLDLQVPAKQDLAAIKAATRGNRNVTAVELAGLNHLFQTATTGSPSEYQTIEETMAPAALKVMGDWIEARTR